MFFIHQDRVGRAHNEILALSFAARELNYQVFTAPTSWRLEEDFINSKPKGLCYGSQIFCEVIAQQLNWELCKLPLNWLATLPKEYTKRDIQFGLVKEFIGIENKFVKPADDKCFDAKIYQSFNISDNLSLETPCLVSESVSFKLEYRYFVNDNKVLTYSDYSKYMNENIEKDIYNCYFSKYGTPLEFICAFLTNNVVNVPSVIDVGCIDDLGWAVLESNPIWASGLYDCDPVNALMAMNGSIKYDYIK
jgi:hypothetical protein